MTVPSRPRQYRIIAIAFTALMGGCATLPDPQLGNLSSDSPAIRSCAAWYQRLDQAVDQAGVRDAGARRAPGFPYLRVDRFLASFREQAAADDGIFEGWLRRLRGLDSEARAFELRNLPEPALRELEAGGREQAIARSEECAAELARHDLGVSSSGRKQLVTGAIVPDDYSDWQRAFGLYGLSRVPFAKGVERWHQEAAAMFEQSRNGSGPVRRYRRFVPDRTIAASSGQIAGILGRAAPDRLGVPQLSDEDRETLFSAFAPAFEIEAGGPYDHFGPVVWRESPAPEVDASNPVAYRRLAYTRYGGRTLLQLVYSIWFPERPYDHALDLLAGRLDGVVVRVTLSPSGEPLVYDSIHPCGCYHMFFPTPLAQPRPAPEPGDEWAFIPTRLPVIAAGQRVVARLAARTHYLVDIAPDQGGAQEGYYRFLEEDSLRSLPAGDGKWRSIYGPDGMVPGTERGERMLFWPMGIASAGAMRQWGRHATAFLGRRHFDDADLIERRFSIDLR